MISQEELDLYKRLQPVFYKKMGPWQVGDNYYDPITQLSGYVSIEYINYVNHPRFGNFIRLPLPIDPRNPERGLWGVINGKCGISLHLYKGNHYVNNGTGQDYIGKTPTLALLRALAAQEGV